MKLPDLLADLPPVKIVPGARAQIAAQLLDTRTRLAVVDDDPTGSQTVHGVRVYLDWSPDTLRRALASNYRASFFSVNTRALPEREVEELAFALGRDLEEVARSEGVNLLVASRSDSTLRGHFPVEVDALVAGLGWRCDGVIIAPAFFEAGRYTVGDVHYVDQGDRVVPASKTEFARDPTFAYQNANLKQWVEEKTAGRFKAEDVRSISLDTIRTGGPAAVAAELMQVSGGQQVIVNAACYDDLEVFVLGLLAAESNGKRFIYRCAAPFVKVRGGIADRPLLTAEEIGVSGGAGLIVVGSYVGKTSRQLESLLQAGLATGIEMQVEALLGGAECEAEIARVAMCASNEIAAGRSVAIYTSRAVLSTEKVDFLEAGKRIMAGLCEAVGRIRTRPAFLVAKGGITSMEVARVALGIKGALVLGQIRDGVPVWKLGDESKWPGMPYIVFPGNVGDDDALQEAVSILSGDE